MAQLYTNNAASKLLTGISNSALSLQITGGHGVMFPSPTGGDYFLVTLSKISAGVESAIEIVKVTGRATDVFTIVRAQEGTTGLTYLTDDNVQLRMTAATSTTVESHLNNVANPHTTTATQVGLGNVTNTSDANKPVSTAQQTALDLKANLASPTFTGTVGGMTKAMVGLANVDNTTDVGKPVSTAQATADGVVLSSAASDATSKANAAAAASVPVAHAGAGGTAHANVIAAGAAGFMTGADKTKLDGIASGATASVATVTAVSFTAANGFTGSIATATTTPAITVGTGLSGILKGNATAMLVATAGTDYVAPGTTSTFSVVQNFAASGMTLKGSLAGYTTFQSENTSITNYVLTFPAVTGTVLTTAAPISITQGGTGAITAPLALTALGAQATLVSGTNIKTVNSQSLLGSGDIVLGGGGVNGTTISDITLQGYNEVVSTQTIGTATANLDLSTTNTFDLTLNLSCTFTFTNPPASGKLKTVTVILRQGTGGTRTATFTNAKYTDAVVPTLSTTVGQVDVLSFFTVNAGAMYFGSFAMANVS